MTPLQIIATSFALVSGGIGAVISVESRYEKQETAEHVHEQLAAENDSARLQFNLELIKIKLEKFKELANVRQLSESEQIELRAVEKERDVLLERLATKG